ncbi:MAG: cytochrome c oxidase assembly protein [Roseiflexaceae bacterium]|nr:cytochrome c oxidase assembly protein [Roseiflexaceae bacterium]
MYAWNWEPGLVLGLIAQISIYLACVGPLRRFFPNSAAVSKNQIQLFAMGWLCLFAALVSPIDILSDSLLSMHMIQHLLITLIAPPLLLLGTPRWLFRPLLRIPGATLIGRLMTSVVPAFIIYNMTFSLWHVPRYYELTLNNQIFHILEHVMFIGTATLAWWPICSPLDEVPSAPVGLQIFYLFFQSFPPTILGAILTFAELPLYPHYTRVARLWGMTPLVDQQLAGLIMWIPGSLIFFGVLSAVFIRWMNRDDIDPRLAKRA